MQVRKILTVAVLTLLGCNSSYAYVLDCQDTTKVLCDSSSQLSRFCSRIFFVDEPSFDSRSFSIIKKPKSELIGDEDNITDSVGNAINVYGSKKATTPTTYEYTFTKNSRADTTTVYVDRVNTSFKMVTESIREPGFVPNIFDGGVHYWNGRRRDEKNYQCKLVGIDVIKKYFADIKAVRDAKIRAVQERAKQNKF